MIMRLSWNHLPVQQRLTMASCILRSGMFWLTMLALKITQPQPSWWYWTQKSENAQAQTISIIVACFRWLHCPDGQSKPPCYSCIWRILLILIQRTLSPSLWGELPSSSVRPRRERCFDLGPPVPGLSEGWVWSIGSSCETSPSIFWLSSPAKKRKSLGLTRRPTAATHAHTKRREIYL